MRLYLDTCCLNRPFDEPSSESVRVEIAAIKIIMDKVQWREWTLIGSDALAAEISRNPDLHRRQAVEAMLEWAREWIVVDATVMALARRFGAYRIAPLDALHLACATVAKADVFLTVDKRLYRRAQEVQSLGAARTRMLAAWLESLEEEPRP